VVPLTPEWHSLERNNPEQHLRAEWEFGKTEIES
jgi:hypothetical protein